MMQPHEFDLWGQFRIPRMVTNPILISLGVGAPLHPYLRAVIEHFDVAPLQLSPNSYKLVLALLILYHEKGFPAPTMDEVSYFFGIRRSDHGYFYPEVNRRHTQKGFGEGKVNHLKGWKEPYCYLHDVPRIRVRFNNLPRKRAYSPLFLTSSFLHLNDIGFYVIRATYRQTFM